MLKFLVQTTNNEDINDNESGTKLLTSHQVDQLETLCHKLMHNNATGVPYKHFYQALMDLPPYDGLRLATIHILIGDVMSGGDLLRMTNNIVRLNEWQKAQQQKRKQQEERLGVSDSISHTGSSTVLNLLMDRDWSTDHYEESLVRVSEFLLEDLRFYCNDTGHTDCDNETTAFDYGEAAKEQFVAKVTWNALDRRFREHEGNPVHFTRDGVGKNRTLLEEELRSDELFGPILSSLETIVYSAHGLKEYPD